MRLLEKVEELTLYTLAQDNELQQKDEKITALTARLDRMEAMMAKLADEHGSDKH